MPRPPRIHPQPSELAAQQRLQALPELEAVNVTIGWDALSSWDGQQSLVTIDDIFSDMPGPFGVQNCIQIDVWSPDRAEELARAIWEAAGTADVARLRAPQFFPDQGGRWSLDLEFRLS